MANYIILKDRAVLPPGLAEHLEEEVDRKQIYQLTRLRPTCCMLDFDAGPELIPSILELTAAKFRCARILDSEDGEPWVYLELDSSVSSLIEARSRIRCAATYRNDYRGVVGVWLEVRGNSFELRDWKETMEFLRDLSLSATVFLFLNAINRPVVQELILYVSDHVVLGLKKLPSSRYGPRQLALIAMSYLRTMKFDIRNEELFLVELTTRMARMNPCRVRHALLLADYFARHAVVEEGRPVVYPETISQTLD